MSALNRPAPSPRVRELAERFLSLTLAEAAALRDYLGDVHGIRPAALSPRPPQPTPPLPQPEPAQLDVVLEGLADAGRRIDVFKAVREVTGLGLKETRELLEAAPAVVRAGLAPVEANALRKKLEGAGARVALVPA